MNIDTAQDSNRAPQLSDGALLSPRVPMREIREMIAIRRELGSQMVLHLELESEPNQRLLGGILGALGWQLSAPVSELIAALKQLTQGDLAAAQLFLRGFANGASDRKFLVSVQPRIDLAQDRDLRSQIEIVADAQTVVSSGGRTAFMADKVIRSPGSLTIEIAQPALLRLSGHMKTLDQAHDTANRGRPAGLQLQFNCYQQGRWSGGAFQETRSCLAVRIWLDIAESQRKDPLARDLLMALTKSIYAEMKERKIDATEMLRQLPGLAGNFYPSSFFKQR